MYVLVVPAWSFAPRCRDYIEFIFTQSVTGGTYFTLNTQVYYAAITYIRGVGIQDLFILTFYVLLHIFSL